MLWRLTILIFLKGLTAPGRWTYIHGLRIKGFPKKIVLIGPPSSWKCQLLIANRQLFTIVRNIRTNCLNNCYMEMNWRYTEQNHNRISHQNEKLYYAFTQYLVFRIRLELSSSRHFITSKIYRVITQNEETV